jgi:hypothetical protein
MNRKITRRARPSIDGAALFTGAVLQNCNLGETAEGKEGRGSGVSACTGHQPTPAPAGCAHGARLRVVLNQKARREAGLKWSLQPR